MKRLTSSEMYGVGSGHCGKKWYERELFLNLCGLGAGVFGGLATLGNPMGAMFGYAVGRAGCRALCC